MTVIVTKYNINACHLLDTSHLATQNFLMIVMFSWHRIYAIQWWPLLSHSKSFSKNIWWKFKFDSIGADILALHLFKWCLIEEVQNFVALLLLLTVSAISGCSWLFRPRHLIILVEKLLGLWVAGTAKESSNIKDHYQRCSFCYGWYQMHINKWK